MVHAVALAQLAPAIEAFVFHRDSARFESELTEIFKEDHEAYSGWTEVILGCTHYPLVAKHIEKILNVKTISPTVAIVDQMVRVIDSMSLPKGQKTNFGPPSTFDYCDTEANVWRKALMSEFLPLP